MPDTVLVIQNVQELTWCIQTLEAYALTTCSDYPATTRTAMDVIEIQTGGIQAASIGPIPTRDGLRAARGHGQQCLARRPG